MADGVAERARFLAALDRLPEGDREVLRLIGWEQLDLGQAAAAMGCSLAVRLHRARRRRLERALNADEDTHDNPGGNAARGTPPLTIIR